MRLTGCLVMAWALGLHPSIAESGGEFRHWQALRDAQVVRQEKDFSCGLAALATMLTYYFAIPVSEAELLGRLDLPEPGVVANSLSGGDVNPGKAARLKMLQERGVSLAVLAQLALDYGLLAQGVSIAPEALSRLAVPAIAYIEPDGEPHFTLVRGVDENGDVQLADPSWGNRRLSAADFARMFAVGENSVGRLLLVLPAGEAAGRQGWFGVDRPQPRMQPPALHPQSVLPG